MLGEAQRKADTLRAEGNRLEEQLGELTEKLKVMRREAMQIAEKLYLTCSLEVFRRAQAAARMYGKHFYRLRSVHEIYVQMICHIEELKEHMGELEDDMDQIRYDAGNTERALRKEQSEYLSVKDQLKLTDS